MGTTTVRAPGHAGGRAETARLLESARAHLPGGGIWTFSHRPAGFGAGVDAPEFIIDRAEGAYAWTTDGDRLLDMVLGFGCTIVGHSHPEVVEAVARRLPMGANYAHLSPPAIELAARLTDIVPCAQRVRFFNSGTEAWTIALRLVRALTGRDRILKLEGGFHGGNDATLFNTNFGDVEYWAPSPEVTPDTPGIPAAAASSLLLAPYDDVAAARAIALAHRHELAAILVEPVQRGIAARPGFLEGMRALADEIGIPLVFDEVITGFRLALGGAQEFYGVTPDLAVLGKGLGSGFPIGALVGSEAAMKPLDPKAPDAQRIVAEGSTLANPISATAALATLDILSRPGTYEHLHGWGTALGDGLRDAFARHGRTIQVTGVGPIVEFFVADRPVHDYLTAMGTDLGPKARLAGGLRGQGVFGGGGRYNVSLAHGDVELSLMLDAVEAVLAGS